MQWQNRQKPWLVNSQKKKKGTGWDECVKQICERILTLNGNQQSANKSSQRHFNPWVADVSEMTPSTGAGADKYTLSHIFSPFWRHSSVGLSKINMCMLFNIAIPLLGREICPIEVLTRLQVVC